MIQRCCKNTSHYWEVYSQKTLVMCRLALALQQRKIVLQTIAVLMMSKAPLVNCDQITAVENLNAFRQRLSRNRLPAELHRYRIAVRIITNRAVAADPGLCAFCRIIFGNRKWVEFALFLLEQSPYISMLTSDCMIQILLTTRLQQNIEFVHAFNPGQRDTEVPAAEAHQTLYETLFVSGGNIAEDGLESVMGQTTRHSCQSLLHLLQSRPLRRPLHCRRLRALGHLKNTQRFAPEHRESSRCSVSDTLQQRGHRCSRALHRTNRLPS